MDGLTRKYISELAQRVMDVYNIKTPIVDMESIVQRLGGTIEEKSDFDDLCDGTIQKSGKSNFKITISPYQNNQRKNFTIAHELGHLFLHMGFGVDPDLWSRQLFLHMGFMTDRKLWNTQDEKVYGRFGTSEQEYQANEFAAALLMPENIYKDILDEHSRGNKVNMNEVAKYFKVSLSAAINRGKFLGYLA